MSQNSDIASAIHKFKCSADRYAKTTRYYLGDHDLCFATEKFLNAFGTLFREFALNLCPAVVDAVRDKLVITEFGIEDGEKNISDDAWKIWQMNRMGVRAGEVHKEAVKNGDSYAIVWPNPAGEVTIYPQRAANCTVEYDEETPGKILWAAKYWKTNDKRFRLNLYYADRIERYVTKAADEWQVTTKANGLNWASNGKRKNCWVLPDAKQFVPYVEDGNPVVRNQYGKVPVFHFANNSDIGCPGMSELHNAIPIQDALNKSVLDMMVAMEFASYRQRWATGIEIDYDETTGEAIPPYKSGIERLWTTDVETAKFGSFDATDLQQFLTVKDGFRIDLACVTGTPLYYFMQTEGDFPSGEALKKSETRFINKVRDRQESFGQVWEDLMAFALLIENLGKGVRLFAKWEDPSPVSETETLNNLLLKQQINIPDETLWMEAGYGKADIAKMTAANKAKRDEMVKSFNAGEDPTADPNAQ
jgi:hypothetical protein